VTARLESPAQRRDAPGKGCWQLGMGGVSLVQQEAAALRPVREFPEPGPEGRLFSLARSA